MSCCGDGRGRVPGVQVSAGRSGLTPNAAQRTPFEYTGRTSLVVVSPITGRRYVFAGPGALIEADARDTHFLAAIPRLRAAR